MVTIEGTLNIKKINGTKGAFCVGDLVTPVGTFKVKDPRLDQFEEGKYKGTFTVTQIYPASFVHYGKVITEVRANIDRFILDDMEVVKVPSAPAPAEPDPADEGNVMPVMTAQSAVDTTIAGSSASVDEQPGEEIASASDDESLFGPEIFPAVEGRQAVKLDPNVDRKVFRAQRDRLKVLGYKFEAALQTWVVVGAQVAKTLIP